MKRDQTKQGAPPCWPLLSELLVFFCNWPPLRVVLRMAKSLGKQIQDEVAAKLFLLEDIGVLCFCQKISTRENGPGPQMNR